jgi:soluble lytic murein transglycosylase-like protein
MHLFLVALLATISNVDAYARALQHFNRTLDGATSRALSQRLIADADAARIDARFVVALIAVESSWHPGAVSRVGAIGLGQLMPGTAAGLGVDPRDPYANVDGTVAHVASLLARYGSEPAPRRYALVLAAYNAGAYAVARYGGVPPYAETRAYVRDVLALWQRLTSG